MKLRHLRNDTYNIFPIDGPDIVVGPGEEFEVDDELGKNLLLQEGNYERADGAKTAARSAKKED